MPSLWNENRSSSLRNLFSANATLIWVLIYQISVGHVCQGALWEDVVDLTGAVCWQVPALTPHPAGHGSEPECYAQPLEPPGTQTGYLPLYCACPTLEHHTWRLLDQPFRQIPWLENPTELPYGSVMWLMSFISTGLQLQVQGPFITVIAVHWIQFLFASCVTTPP